MAGGVSSRNCYGGVNLRLSARYLRLLRRRSHGESARRCMETVSRQAEEIKSMAATPQADQVNYQPQVEAMVTKLDEAVSRTTLATDGNIRALDVLQTREQLVQTAWDARQALEATKRAELAIENHSPAHKLAELQFANAQDLEHVFKPLQRALDTEPKATEELFRRNNPDNPAVIIYQKMVEGKGLGDWEWGVQEADERLARLMKDVAVSANVLPISPETYLRPGGRIYEYPPAHWPRPNSYWTAADDLELANNPPDDWSHLFADVTCFAIVTPLAAVVLKALFS
jgi:hypothetical protein